MKKLIMILSLLAVFAGSLAAETSQPYLGTPKDDSKWTDLSYVNVPILKVFEGKDGYRVLYQKNKYGVGNVVIPKKWSKGTTESPKKLKFRTVRSSNQSYMTVVRKNGEFLRVILNVPDNKANSLWGLADYHKSMDGADKDTLEELDF